MADMETDLEITDALAKSAVRSCTTCSKAKAKCVRRPGSQICERCARLNKDCHSRQPVLRRKKPAKTTRTAQLEKLESKIENLVNALSTQQAYRSSEHGQQSPPISQISPSSEKGHSIRTSEVLESLCASRGEEESACIGPMPVQPVTPEGSSASKTSVEFTLAEAEILLDRFKRLMASGMPFVVIPDGTNAARLSEHKPVLLRAICTVTMFHDLARQKTLITELNRDIAERMFVKNEKSLDLLQALLVLVGWYHPHVFWSPQTTNFLHLASALSIDLGIDRIPNACGDFKQATTRAVHGDRVAAPKVHTMEERRALMGIFYLTNMLSSSFRKLDTLPFTSYMDECLQSLEHAREYDSDLFLVQIVRIQCIIEKIHTIDNPSAPARVYVRAFQADIEKLRRKDPCTGANVFLRMQYYSAEILMWELSLNDIQENRATSISAYLEDLYCLITALKGFFDAFFSMPATAYYTLPFTVFGHFAHGFICLTKLASLEQEGWDPKALDEHISFVEIIDECTSRFEAAPQSRPDGLVLHNDSFTKWASKIKWMRNVYSAKFVNPSDCQAWQNDTNATTTRPADTPGQQQQPTPPDDPVLSAEFFNYLDENFWDTFGELDSLLFPAEMEVS